MMKRFIFAAMLLLSHILPAAGMQISSSGGRVGTDTASLALIPPAVYLGTGFLRYGDIGQRGFVKALDDPHSPLSGMKPDAVFPSADSRIHGAVIGPETANLFISSDGRFLAGFSFDIGPVTATAAYASEGGKWDGLQGDAGRTGEHATMYAGISGRWGIFSASGIVSFAEDIGTRGFLSASVAGGKHSIKVSAGTLIPLFSDSPERAAGLSGSFGGSCFASFFSFSWGGMPVYSGSVRPFSAAIESVLELDEAVIRSTMESTAYASGRSSLTWSISASYSIISAGYSTASGVSFSIDPGYFSFGFRNGYPYVSFRPEWRSENASVSISASTDEGFSVSVILDL